MAEDKHYPDLEAPKGSMGDLKKIVRLPRMEKCAPTIRWGNEYMSWSLQKRLSYAERLASAMNHAADVLQQERNKLIELAKEQEKQLEENVKKYTAQGEVLHKELSSIDEEKQKLYYQIVELTKQTNKQSKRIKQLEKQLGNND